MDPADTGCDETRPTRAEIDGVLAATRVLVAISAQSVAKVENQVTLPQLRVLVIIASRGPQNLNSVAQALGVHPSNVTRICDKLVQGGLIHRGDDPADRRHLLLQLTESGRQLVHTMTEHRRAAIATILAKMRIEQRRSLVPELLAFADAAGEVPDSQAWHWAGPPSHLPTLTTKTAQSLHPHSYSSACGHGPNEYAGRRYAEKLRSRRECLSRRAGHLVIIIRSPPGQCAVTSGVSDERCNWE